MRSVFKDCLKIVQYKTFQCISLNFIKMRKYSHFISIISTLIRKYSRSSDTQKLVRKAFTCMYFDKNLHQNFVPQNFCSLLWKAIQIVDKIQTFDA